MPTINAILTRHRLELMAQNVGHFSKEMVREFYASDVVFLQSQLEWRTTPAKHAHQKYFLVRDKWIDISLPAIRKIL